VLKAALAVIAAAGAACAAAPASEQVHVIAPGVRVFGAPVGGLGPQAARLQIERAFTRPLEVVYRGQSIVVTPSELGARASVAHAVRSAIAATPRSRIALPVRYSQKKVDAYVDGLDARFGRKAVNSSIVGADGNGPLFSPSRMGLTVEKATMRRALEQQILSGTRAPLVLLMKAVQPTRTPASYGSIVVIDRGANTLKLYSATRLVTTFHVATGQAAYPTPSGIFSVIDMQRDPWWLPPDSSWAQGLKPVPPGPGNPLGTRWMGISAPGVGMHGTPDDTSIGYSRSHGCIRMHIPDAEWLFTHVELGTPVIIL